MNVYVIAHTSGSYMYPATKKVKKKKKAVLKEYEKIRKQGIKEDLFILKAQWIEADFDEYEEAKKEEDK